MVNIGELGVGLKLENWSIEKLTRDIQNQIKQWGDIAGEKLGKGIEKGLDQKQATNELAKDIEQKVGNAGEKAGNKLQQSLWGGLKALVGLGVTKALSTAAWRAYTLAGNLQQADVAFTTMLGGAEAARRMLQDLSDFAANTPFELTGVRETAKQLLAYNIEAHKIIPTLKALGDVSAGLSVPIQQVAFAYGQVKSAGRLLGQDLRQFTNAGVPIIAELAKNLGVAESKIKDMVSAGKIWFADVEKAFQTMSSEWGKFANLMEKQSDTMMGAWSNLQDSIDSLGEAIGSLFTGEVGGLFKWMASIVEAVKEWAVAHPELTKAIVIFVGVVGGAIGVVTALAGAAAIMGAALGAAALPVLGIAAALGAVAVAAFGVTTEWQRQELYAKHLGKSYSELQKEIDANKEAMAKLTMEYQGGAITAEEYQQKLKELEEKNKELTTAQGITTMSLEEARAKIEEINNSKLSNQQKLQALQEIADKAFGAAKSVEQLKNELAFLQPTIDKIQKSKEFSRSGFWAQIALDFRDTFSWIPWVKSTNQIQAEYEVLNQQLQNRNEGQEDFNNLLSQTDVLGKQVNTTLEDKSGGGGGSSWTSKKAEKLKEVMDWLKKSLKDAEDADKKYRDSAKKTAEEVRKYYEKLGDEIRSLEIKYKKLIENFEKQEKSDKEGFLRSQVEKAKDLEEKLSKGKSALIDLKKETQNKKDQKLSYSEIEELFKTADLSTAQSELKKIQQELETATSEYDRERLKEKQAILEVLKEQLTVEQSLKAVNGSVDKLGLDQSVIDKEKKRAELNPEEKAIYDFEQQQKKKQEEFEKEKKRMEREMEIYKFFQDQKFASSAEVQKLISEENLKNYSLEEQELILKLGRERIQLEQQKEEKIRLEEDVHRKFNQLSNDTTNLQIKNLGKLKNEYRSLIAQIETALAKQAQLRGGRGFAIWGFTGSGANNEIAGVVHKNERVAPAWMTSKFADTFNQLEKIRTRGFAQGGFTTDNSRHIEQNNTINVQSVFDAEEFLDRQRRKLR